MNEFILLAKISVVFFIFYFFIYPYGYGILYPEKPLLDINVMLKKTVLVTAGMAFFLVCIRLYLKFFEIGMLCLTLP